ncbi:MAG TPA: hypothetical protein VN838_05970, partial [Bradyrhizobium sp.]|nr:hypothetical protein [Bradyrhizobium sp.]
EIAALVEQVANRKIAARPSVGRTQPAYVHVTGLPETAYEKLQGRDDVLKRLDDAWTNRSTNVLSLIAEGGAGKSALVNEWLKRMLVENYRGAEAVLGWSFYNQGTKERATSAEPFLNWAIEKLSIKNETTSANVKGEVIAEEMAKRRILLLLDGCEPLQHALDKRHGELRDQGLRALLRRFATMPPNEAHGLVVLTSRLPINDIGRWNDGSAPVIDVEKLPDEAGAALLRDNGVWGTDVELNETARAFGGHPLSLGLLASFLKETQTGDVRRRDHISVLVRDEDNPRHGHAKRVMESYEREWLAKQPVERTIMHMIGLFDRPASGGCLLALRENPPVQGLTDTIVGLDESEWQRGVSRLREARLLSPLAPSAPDTLDAHPLVREWFGDRLKETNEEAWKAAHGRLYEHLRDTTEEGETPTLEELGPLFQAIVHGCRAGRHEEALHTIYLDRICRRHSDGNLEFYASKKLGAVGSDLAAMSSFFETPYTQPVFNLKSAARAWVLGQAAFRLRALGRLAEALPVLRAALQNHEDARERRNAAVNAINLSETELAVGEIARAIITAKTYTARIDQDDIFLTIAVGTTHANALFIAGKRDEAEVLFAHAEHRQKDWSPKTPLLYAVQGYEYCDLLLEKGYHAAVRDRAIAALYIGWQNQYLLDIALYNLILGRIHFGLAWRNIKRRRLKAASKDAGTCGIQLNQSIDGLRDAGTNHYIPRGLLSLAAFHRGMGNWAGAKRDLDEVEEIAEPGPMRLNLCDLALERARLALANIEAFAPLNGMVDDSPPKPIMPNATNAKNLKEEAAEQLVTAAHYITTCGYHRRDEELAELQAVLRGERKFADLPPRI